MKSLLALSIYTAFSLSAHALDIGAITGFDAIYGEDDREYVSLSSSVDVRKLSDSIALLVRTESMSRQAEGKTLIGTDNLMGTTGVCSDVKFAKERSIPACSSFLIAPDVMVTAGHCIEASECKRGHKKFIFGVTQDKTTDEGYLVNRSDIYSCKKILKRNLAPGNDYAIVKLDREVTDRSPLKLNKDNSLTMDSHLFMIGHPMGQALVHSKTSGIYDLNEDAKVFYATLDSFFGNSGSPVFNAKTLEVEGILITGQGDLLQDNARRCRYYETHEDGGEGVLRIKTILDLLK